MKPSAGVPHWIGFAAGVDVKTCFAAVTLQPDLAFLAGLVK